jgi:sulfofructose kinase
MAFDVVGVGHATVDHLGIVPRFPEVDTKNEMLEFSIQGGGPVATALVTLACLGVRTTFMGKISDDDFGTFIRQGFREAGVDTSGLIIDPGKVSPYSFIAIEKGNGSRTIFWTRGDVDLLDPEDLRLDLLQGARAVLVDGLQMEAQVVVARKARSMGIPVIYDAGSPREGMEALIANTDVLVASELFAAEVGGGALAESLRRLNTMGPRTVVITIGEEGSVGMEGDETFIVPAVQVDVVDTTGAGDVYHGAFIYGLLQGWDLNRRMRFANAAAALKCRFIGGRAGIPELPDIYRALK